MLTEKQMKYCKTLNSLNQARYKRAFEYNTNKKGEKRYSMKRCIVAKCVECQGNEDTVKGIHECTGFTCPLWNVRPFQHKKDTQYERACEDGRIK